MKLEVIGGIGGNWRKFEEVGGKVSKLPSKKHHKKNKKFFVK